MNETKPELPVKRDTTVVEYVPYGAQDKIKLNIGIVQNLIAVKTKSGKTCSDRDALKFLAMCQAKRMNPFEGDCFLIGYDGRDGASFALVTAHQTYLKRAELHPEFDGMKSGLIIRDVNHDLRDLEGDFYDEGQIVVGGWATVFFKNRKQPMHKRLRLERFKKGFGIWLEDAAGMICKCAEADALRSAFPTMLGGLYLREEIQSPAEVIPLKPQFQSKALFEVPEKVAQPEPQAEPVSEYVPNASEGSDAPAQNGFNPLKAVRNLAKAANITEGKLLEFLSASGSTDGSVATLDELAMSFPQVLALVAEQWGDISARIQKGGDK